MTLIENIPISKETTPYAENNTTDKQYFAGRYYGKFDPSRPIPKVIHHIWINQNNEIPDCYKKEWRDSWKKIMPDWKVKVWYAKDVEALLRKKYPIVLRKYNSYHIPVCKADIARLAILHSEGGVYTDLDFECLKPIDRWIENKNAFFIATDTENLKTTSLRNSILASTANHPIFKKALTSLKPSQVTLQFSLDQSDSAAKLPLNTAVKLLQNCYKKGKNSLEISKICASQLHFLKFNYIFNATGPRFLTRTVIQKKNKGLSISLVPSPPFFPYEGSQRAEFTQKDSFAHDVYAVHRYTALWFQSS